MNPVLFIESCTPGVLVVNGQFCGPLEEEGQAFPAGKNAEIYAQLFPFDPAIAPLCAAMALREGRIARLEPQAHAFALHWPDGVIELELRPAGAQEGTARQEEPQAAGVLLRYLTMRLAGEAQADGLLMPRAVVPDLSGYAAAVPLPHAPGGTGGRYDERAGLVRRITGNTAQVDAAMAVLVPAGQGHRLITRIDVFSACGQA